MLGQSYPKKEMVVKSNEIGIDAGFLELANAIVIKAVEDYRALRNRSFYRDNYEKRLTESKIKQIERFFTSSYGDMVCRGTAAYIWDNLQEEFE